ncbi:hypothetical protein KLEB273_gp169 [Bacillus phage vB_BauM_KLEB27-3]|nr:hypothetical protein KLEB273_gp169 [Bacillus phage vB_BauM_KLEB27-3]
MTHSDITNKIIEHLIQKSNDFPTLKKYRLEYVVDQLKNGFMNINDFKHSTSLVYKAFPEVVCLIQEYYHNHKTILLEVTYNQSVLNELGCDLVEEIKGWTAQSGIIDVKEVTK